MSLVREAPWSGGDQAGTRLHLWCPACDDLHSIEVGSTQGWTWDHNEEAPTIAPSIKVSGVQWPEDSPFRRKAHPSVTPGQPTCCHSFVEHGVWRFLTDCTHALGGQNVPMVPLPDGLFAEP